MSNTTRCNQCGTSISGSQIGSTTKSFRNGSMMKVRATTSLCQDCHAAGEYKQEQYRRQLQQEIWDSMTPDQQAGYIARKGSKPEGVN